jgi:cytochrome P450
MMWLTQVIVAKALFNADVRSEASEVTQALSQALSSGRVAFRLPFSRLLERLHLPGFRRFYEARDRLDAIVYRIIAEHRQSGQDQGDLLSTMLNLSDEAGAMSDKQLRDEMLTLFLAGHETTANALTWTWYLLAHNPEAEARLHAELDTVLAGRLPAADDMPQLVYTEKVLREAMRIYPPAPMIARRALKDHPIGGYVLPADTIVLLSAYLTQHDARFYPEPEHFDPDRWTPEFRKALPHFAYFPFSGGPRQCIGESFAWMEGILLIATLAQHWRLRLVPNHPPVRPKLAVTLRPSPGVRMIAERRG